MTGGADFGGGLTEWQTLQFLLKTAAPSTGTANADAGEIAGKATATRHAQRIFFIFRLHGKNFCGIPEPAFVHIAPPGFSPMLSRNYFKGAGG
jgi:hypothetical protein